MLCLGYSVPGINAVPHDDNLRYFDVSIHGPAQSPYEGRLAVTKASCPIEVLTYFLQVASSDLSSSYQTTIL